MRDLLEELHRRERNMLVLASFTTTTAIAQGALWLCNASPAHAGIAGIAATIAPLAWRAWRRAKNARLAFFRRLRKNILGAGA